MKRSILGVSIGVIAIMLTSFPLVPSARADVLLTIKQRGELVNGVEAQNPPFEYVEKGKIIGYDIDLAEAIAKSQGVKLKVIDTAWSGIIPALYSKKFDMILSAMTVTQERMKQVGFSAPLASDQVIVFTRANDMRVKRFADLVNMTVGTQLNSAIEQLLKAYAEKHKVKFKELKLYDHFDEAFLDLQNGRVDAAVTGIITGKLNFLKKFPGKFRMAVQPPIYIYMAAAIRKDDEDLLNAVNTEIAAMKKSGALRALQMKWFGFEMHLPVTPRPPEIAE